MIGKRLYIRFAEHLTGRRGRRPLQIDFIKLKLEDFL
jgi:hypothetical protein